VVGGRILLMSYIYIIAYDPKGPIKIGKSSNPNQRLTELQTGNPYKLELMCVKNFFEERFAKFAEDTIKNYLIKKKLKTNSGGDEWYSTNLSYAKSILAFFPTYWPDKNDKTESGNFVYDLQRDKRYSKVCTALLLYYNDYFFEHPDEEPLFNHEESDYHDLHGYGTMNGWTSVFKLQTINEFKKDESDK
jgi:hypothetical protein